jgi:biopolymer transport protein ExbB
MISQLRTARLVVVSLMILAALPARAQPTTESASPPPTHSQATSADTRSTSTQIAPTAAEMPVATTDPKAIQPALRELSPWSMFLSADILVQAVMMSLAFASLVTWTIFLAMSAKLFLTRQRLNRTLAAIDNNTRTLHEAQLALGPNRTVLASLLKAAIQEIRISAEADGRIEQRAASRFSEIVRTEARAIRGGMGALATIASTSPFVGLFGTVWGIMNSFIGISKSQTTNLAVVAPGIAEALLATAFGLVAAIPAVIIYNHFSRATKGYLDLVGRASGTAGRLLSRDLDRAASGRELPKAAE